MRPEEINIINLDQYTLGAQYCRTHLKQGGVSIFALDGVETDVIDLSESCKEKDFEICVIKIQL
jgi:hypothetical protein